MRISASTIDEVNARTDIISVIGEYVRLEKRGGNYWGCCPFHNEKTPSFSVEPDRKFFYCFGCHKGGSTVSFVMEMENFGYAEAIQFLAKKAGVEVIYESGAPTERESAAHAAQNQLREDLLNLYKRLAATYRFFLNETEQGKGAKAYLESRGVSAQIAEEFGLGYAPADRRWLHGFLASKNYSAEFLAQSGLFSKNYPEISFFSDRLMFPICNRKGQVVAFGARALKSDENTPKYLNSGDMPQYKKGETLYAFHLAKSEIREKKAVVLCEGYMDVIAYHQAGIRNAVAPLGTALTEEQIKILSPFAETFYLSFDGDSAGQNATYRAILMCRKAGLTVKVVRISSWFDGANGAPIPKDPADVLLNYGPKTLTNIVAKSIIDADYLLSTLAKKYPVDTPEGKSKAALDFFPYIDALQLDNLKESYFEQLCRTFELNPKAARADFNNRNAAQQRNATREQTTDSNVTIPRNIKKNAELRAMLAVTANTQYFAAIRSAVSPEDFEDAAARELFYVLEECFREDTFAYDVILSKCSDEELRSLISETLTSAEFSENAQKTIEDSIALVKRNSLERKRERLVNKIRQWNGSTLEDLELLKNMQYEKMSIDNELKANKKDTDE